MSTSSERAPFVESQFLEDLDSGSSSVGAPYSEAVVKEVIAAYGECFHDSAVQLRCGNAPGRPLMFRVMFAIPTDTLEIALNNGWVAEGDPMVAFHKALKQQCPGIIDQPEVLVDTGFKAVWQFLGDLCSLDHILATPGLSDGVKANKEHFLALGLTTVPITHLGYRQKTIDLYFLSQGGLTKDQLTRTIALAGEPEPSDEVFNQLRGLLLDAPHYCTVVMEFDTGKVLRVEYHFLFPIKLPDELEIPDLGERLETFWEIPSYEYEDMDILSFCFGDCPNGSVLALRSYCGGLRSLMKAWKISGV